MQSAQFWRVCLQKSTTDHERGQDDQLKGQVAGADFEKSGGNREGKLQGGCRNFHLIADNQQVLYCFDRQSKGLDGIMTLLDESYK